MDRNTEQWVNDQNKFWEKKRGSLEETMPKVFEPQAPVRILQRGKQPQSEVAKQTPIKTGVNRDFWNSSYGGPNYRSRCQMGYPSENRNWKQKMDIVEGMAMGIKTGREGPMGGLLLRLKHITPPQGEGFPMEIHHPEEWVVDREMVMGMVKIKMIKIEKSIETLNSFEEEDEEESDTEDSFEFEITPQQLSQVTPGGGVLKLTLTKKGPLNITTEAQNKRPDSSQTTVKTVYDPTKEKEPLQGSESIKDKTTYRERGNFENQRIKSREAPNDKRDGSFPEGEGPVRQIKPDGDGGPDGNGGPNKGKKPPRKGEGPPGWFRKKMGVEEDQILVMMMGMEVDLLLPHQKTPH